MADIKINVSDSIGISDSITISKESNYLLISNREKVTKLLNSSDLTRDNLIDVFISLHIILEVGINSLFRALITPLLKKQVDTHEMVENLDKVNFIDKVVMFVYYSKFRFKDLGKATEYHSIINKLRNFSEMRNRLLHGHSISSRFEDGKNSESRLMQELNLSRLQKQLADFRFILDGLGFYLDSLDMGLTENGKASYKKAYLDYGFLPQTHFRSE